MRKSSLLPFTLSEYENRINKFLTLMQQDEVTAVVLASDENINYFTGFQSIVWDSKVATPAVLVINSDGSTLITTTGGNAQTAYHTSCVDEVCIYGGDSAFVTIGDATKDMIIDAAKVGFELGVGHKMHLNHINREETFDKVGRDNICDISDVLWKIRSIKSASEIEVLRKVSMINAIAIENGLKNVYEGMTEMELYQNIMSGYFKGGAEFALKIGVRAGESRYSQANCPASYNKIQKGDVILVDGGPILSGYYSDIIRQAIIGEPTDRQMDMFTIARDACNMGIAAMKPVIAIDDVCDVVSDKLLSSKYGEFTSKSGWCGHSIGVGVHEYPMLTPKTGIKLEEGMVFAIEPYFFEDKVGSLGIEENVVITKDGCEILSKSDSNLMIL